MRLAYDVAVSETLGLQIDWKSYIAMATPVFKAKSLSRFSKHGCATHCCEHAKSVTAINC